MKKKSYGSKPATRTNSFQIARNTKPQSSKQPKVNSKKYV